MIIASLIYLRKDGKTLMLHRNKKDSDYHLGKYNGIGGKLEKGESPEACAIREIQEETGLIASALKYRGHLTFPDFDGETDWLCFIYECFDFQGELMDCNEGSLHWIEDSQLYDLNLWEGDPYFLKVIYETKKCFYGVFTYHQKKLVHYDLTTYDS